MGYTHYYTRDKRNVGTAEQYGRLALDAKAIIAEARAQGLEICGAWGEGEPEFTEAYFALNGSEKDGLAYEGFAWEGAPEQPDHQRKYKRGTVQENEIFDFCKTAQKPYDAVVTAILIRAKVIYGDIVDIGSDGDWETDWQAGRDLYEKVFGEPAVCPLDPTTWRKRGAA